MNGDGIDAIPCSFESLKSDVTVYCAVSPSLDAIVFYRRSRLEWKLEMHKMCLECEMKERLNTSAVLHTIV